MEPLDLLKHVVQVLDRLALPYAVGGSVASMFYAEPRFTNDIDIVVNLPPDRIGDFVAAFPPGDFYLSRDAAEAAVRHRGQFNIIHPDSGLKADIIIPKPGPIDDGQLSRARRVRPRQDFEALFASPEDVIVKKLQAYDEGGSEKHLRDIASMLKIQGDQIDSRRVEAWARALGVEAAWVLVKGRLGLP